MAAPNEVLEALDEMMALYYQRSKHDPDYDRDIYDIILEWQSSLPQVPQPDWSQAPEWAMWWCVGPDGRETWTETEPRITLSRANWYWGYRYEWTPVERDIPIGIDWRLLKRRRPEAM